MELTAKNLAKHPAFLIAAKEMEPILKESLVHFFKLPKEQKKSWHSKLKSINQDLDSGKMQAKDLPKDFTEQLGMRPASKNKLEQVLKNFVVGMKLKKDDIKMSKKQLEGEARAALELINFGKGTTDAISYDMLPPEFIDDIPVFVPNEDQIQACKDACWVEFMPQLALAIIVFAALLLICALISILSLGLAAGPCISTALAIFLVILADGLAKYDACSDSCEGQG